MNNRKLSLDKLRIKSFVTEPNQNQVFTVKGGGLSVQCDTMYQCTFAPTEVDLTLLNCIPRTILDCPPPVPPTQEQGCTDLQMGG